MGHKYQSGMAMSKLLMVAIFVAISANFVVKMAPHYIDDYYVKSIFNEMERDFDVASESNRSLKETLEKRLSISNVEGVSDLIKFDRKKRDLTISLEYERRESIMGNVDVVMKFQHEYQYSL